MYSNQTLSEEAVDPNMIEVPNHNLVVVLFPAVCDQVSRYSSSKHGIMDKDFQDMSQALSA